MFKSKEKKDFHIYLLYFASDATEHYAWIKNLSKLICTTRGSWRIHKHICDTCLTILSSEEKLLQHQGVECFNIVTKAPNPGTQLQFQNYYKKK